MADTRDIVLDILMDIEISNTFSDKALSKALSKNQFIEKNQRAFITRLAEGVIESKIRLDYIINNYSKIKTDKLKPMILCIIRMGVYQMLYLDSVPDSAACNESVKLAKKHGLGGLSGYVNGVLRSISREKNNIKLPSKGDNNLKYLSVLYSVPEWLIEKLMEDYPKEYRKILDGCFEERKTTVRINKSKISREKLIEMLKQNNITVQKGYYSDWALLISDYDFIKKVPGYKQGLFTVQDESSISAVESAFEGLNREINDDFIALDICAAPGGKTTAVLEHMNNKGKLYSLDISKEKLSLIDENVKRLGFENVVIDCNDASEYVKKEKFGFDFNSIFNLVIADVPCSGLGIIGRKNDIKYRVGSEQINELLLLQDKILENAYLYTAKDGVLLYSTCTVNPDENNKKISKFLAKHKDVGLLKEKQFIQGVDKCDGFYYAVMKKQ